MPLIQRKVEQKIPHNHAVQYHHITKYVHPTRLRPGDVEVPLHAISDRQLADLATLFPEEYLAPCEERGLTPAQPVEVEDESTPDFDESKPLPSAFRRVPRPAAPVVEAGDEDDEGTDEDEPALEDEPGATIPLDDAQQTFLGLNARTAIAFIEQNRERVAFLGKCYQAEKARTDGPRKTVLAAFTAVGVGAEE